MDTGLTTLSHKNIQVTETAKNINFTSACDGPSGYSETRMNAGDENHKDVTSRMGEDLNTKTKIRLGHWNVRTMYEKGKLAQVTPEMRQFNLHVLGVRESRWAGSGKIGTNSGETVLYAGMDDNLHHEGVAIILRKGVERCLMEWKPISNRMMSARLKGKHINTHYSALHQPMTVVMRTNTTSTASYKQRRKRPLGTTSLASWGTLMPRSEETTPTMKELWENMGLGTETIMVRDWWSSVP